MNGRALTRFDQKRGGLWVRKTIKMTVCFLILLTMIISSACSPKSSETSSSGKKVEIRFAFWGVPEEKEVQEKLKNRFEELHPNITVKLEHITGDYYPPLLTQIAGGNAPDVFYIGEAMVSSLADKGVLMDLMPYAKKDNVDFNAYFEEILKPVGVDENKMWAFPKDTTPYMMYYNKDLFDKAGVEYPTEDWTWKEFEEKAKALTITENGKKTQYGFAQDLGWTAYMTAIYRNGGNILSEDHKSFALDDPKTMEALEWFKDLMYKDGGVSPSPEGLKSLGVGQQDLFNSQKAAMISGGRWISFFIKDVKAKWGVVPFPKNSDDAASPLLFVTLAAPKATKHPKEAWEFIKFVTSEEGQKINASTGLGMPVLKSVTESGEWLQAGEPKEHIDIYTNQMNQARNLPFHPQWGKTIDELAARELDKFFRNKATVEDTVKKIAEEGNPELNKN
jgi:multiple sugar transport system substrate-binding protein